MCTWHMLSDVYTVQVVERGGREVTAHPDNMHLRLNLSLHSTNTLP